MSRRRHLRYANEQSTHHFWLCIWISLNISQEQENIALLSVSERVSMSYTLCLKNILLHALHLYYWFTVVHCQLQQLFSYIMTITVKLNGREKLIGPHRLSMVVVWKHLHLRKVLGCKPT